MKQNPFLWLASKPLVFVSVTLGCGLIVGFLVGRFVSTGSTESSQLRLGQGGLTNPLLECENGGSIGSRKEDFSHDLERFVGSIVDQGLVSGASVYFRDMNNGPVVGVAQNDLFIPASLLKVPLMIAYLRWADDSPAVLDERILYRGDFDAGTDPFFVPETPLVPGTSYTARSLIEAMVWNSDNNAAILLYERLPAEYQEDLYELVGIDPLVITDPTASISVKQYSIFFRILFNASFLSHERSEYALELLTQSRFDQGLVAGVPRDVLVAHKFGERSVGDGIQQFHDCGIVYYPNHPYLLCVMTRGVDVERLIMAIGEISAFVYGRIDEQY